MAFVHGDATSLRDVTSDLVVMTGNVAQVFVGDEEWLATLGAVRSSLRDGGRFVLESRVPERAAWGGWHRAATFRRVVVPGVGTVATWTEVTEVDLPLVSFESHVVLEDTHEALSSTSTLRFRSLDELTDSLDAAGLDVVEVRDAPDRPGLEHVLVATPRE